MPQIPTYNVPEQDSQLRIPEGGAQTLSQGARRLGTMGNEAATAITQGTRQLAAGVEDIGKVLEQHQYNSDVSTMHKDLADFTAYSLKQIGDIEANVDPNNVPQALDQVNQLLADAKEQYGQKYGSKASQAKFNELWTQRSDLIRNHIIGTAASASGDAAVKNMTSSLNTNIGLVRTYGDMSSFDAYLKAGNQSIEDHANMIPGEKRQQFITDTKAKYADQLATSMFESVLTRDPAQAKAILDSGKLDQYLPGQEKNTLYNHVETATRLQQHQARADDAETRRIENQAFNQEATNLELSMMNPDGSLHVPKDFAQSLTKLGGMPGEKADKVENLMKLSRSITEQNAKRVPDQTDMQTYTDLSTRILGNPTQQGLENDLFKAKIDHKLADKDFTILHQAFTSGQKADLSTHLETKTVDSALNTAMGAFGVTPGIPTAGGANEAAYSRFMTWFQSGLASARAGGKTTGDFINDTVEKLQDPKFVARFKQPATPNAGSGLAVTGPGASAPLPPSPIDKLPGETDEQQIERLHQPEGLLHKWWNGIMK